MNWVNSHGTILLLGCWLVAMIISLAPKIDVEKLGFWQRWGWNIMQFVGASADKIVASEPKPKMLAQLTQVTPMSVTQVSASVTETPKV